MFRKELPLLLNLNTAYTDEALGYTVCVYQPMVCSPKKLSLITFVLKHTKMKMHLTGGGGHTHDVTES